MDTDHNAVLAELEAQYFAAREQNQDARSRLRQALEQSKSKSSTQADSAKRQHLTSNTTTDSTKRQHLTSHLENLRLAQHYDKLQMLSYHFEKAERIAQYEKIYDHIDVMPSCPSASIATDETAVQTCRPIDQLLSNAKTLTTDLELALVTARQQLKRERALFKHVQEQQSIESNGEQEDVPAAVRLRALEATRDELQNWIGESLAKCEKEVVWRDPDSTTTRTAEEVDREQPDEALDRQIERQYEEYIEARMRLLSVSKALGSPLASTTTTKTDSTTSTVDPPIPGDNPQNSSTSKRPQHLRYKSHISAIDPNNLVAQPSLAEVKATHLPEYHHQHLLSIHTSHLRHRTSTQDTKLLQVLGLLGHESHLLPTHPLPVPAPGQIHDAGIGTVDKQHARIDEFLRAWAFASQKASERLRETVGLNVEGAEGALRSARGYMDAVRMVEGMRREVLDGR